MKEIIDLAALVDANPTHHEQRWRLAKKLYLACEYEEALRHLVYLKKHWVRRMNVSRYTAAAYYRLGRYDEAIEEVGSAIEVWPQEVGLYEQRARIFEMAGKREDAAATWEEVQHLSATHPLASSAIRRLRSTHRDSDHDELKLAESDSGIPIAAGVICGNCGSQNSAEFERCWQCHAPLRVATPRPAARLAKEPGSRRALAAILVVVGNVCIIIAGIYITAATILKVTSAEDGTPFCTTVSELLAVELLWARVLAGLLLCFLLPGGFVLIAGSKNERAAAENGSPAACGIFLGALTYLCLWTFPQYSLSPFILLAMLSFGVLALLVRAAFGKIVLLWGYYCLLASLVIVVSLAAFQGMRFLRELPVIIAYAGASSGAVSTPPVTTPVSANVQWESSGSAWLDERGGQIEFEVASKPQEPPLVVEFKDATQTVFLKDLSENPAVFRSLAAPGKPYQIVITGKENTEIQISVRGILTPRFTS